MKILMCPPDYYGIEYEINPWMNIANKANSERATSQWTKLYQTITACGADVSLIPPIHGCPDMTFTANAGLYYREKIILSHFKYPEREREAPHFENWFKQAGFIVENETSAHNVSSYFEGAGDALSDNKWLFAGYGFRSDLSFYKSSPYFESNHLVLCELVDPYFYHLDTCFCPIKEGVAIWYPGAFSKESQMRMAEHIKLIDVSADEAKRFACNAVVIGNHVIIPTECPQLTKDLEAQGMTVFHCQMDEYMKAGGACKCLTLRID